MVTVIARWKVKEGKVSEALELAKLLVEASRQEPGNLAYDLYIKDGTTDEVLIFETYKSMADFEFHKQTPHFKEIAADKLRPLLETHSLLVFDPPADT